MPRIEETHLRLLRPKIELKTRFVTNLYFQQTVGFAQDRKSGDTEAATLILASTHKTFAALFACASCFVLLSCEPDMSLVSTDPEAHPALGEAAAEFGQAIIDHNFEKMVSLTYLPVYKEEGDELMEHYEEELEDVDRDLRKVGASFTAFSAEDTDEIVIAGFQMLSLVTYTMNIQTRTVRIEVEIYHVAVSDDQGKSWRFVSGANFQKEGRKKRINTKKMFPGLGNFYVPENRISDIN